MNIQLAAHWNKMNSSIPDDKDVSNYGVEKEALFPRNAVICDLGGSTGIDTMYFLSKGHSVRLLDIADEAIAIAKEKATRLGYGDRLEVAAVDLSEDALPLEDNSVDIVYSRLATHYFKLDRTVEIMREIRRILKPGGTAYLTVKSPADTKEMQFLREHATEIEPGVFENNGQLKTILSIEEWEKILEKAGVVHADVHEYTEYLGKRTDAVASGADSFVLTEMIFTK